MNPPCAVRRPFLPRLALAAALLAATTLSARAAETPGAIRALAQDHIVFDASAPGGPTPLNTPSILSLGDGRLVAASERSGVNSEWRKQGHAWARIATSDDGGRTWTIRTTPNLTQARLFRAGRSLYYLGHAAI